MRTQDERDNRRRVHRGGGWFSTPAYARVASRFRGAPGSRFDGLGVRLVRHQSALERLVEVVSNNNHEEE